MNKVFGVGLPRTGTQSLAAALRIFGYRTTHSEPFVSELERFDAATEVWFPISQLEGKWPGSKYILTERSYDSWMESCRRCLSFRESHWNPFWCYDPESW